MRAAIQILFLLFYCSSSYVTTQHRVSHLIYVLENRDPSAVSTLDESGKERVRYTRFREAKKASLEFYFVPDLGPKFFRLVSNQPFTPNTISLASQFDVETTHSRAPPM
jgi:hypothetical protein